jgi:predicted MFS family arabinose efflux permease
VGSVFAFVNAFMVTGILAGPLLGHRLGLLRTVAATQLLSIPFMMTLALTFDVRIAVTALMLRAALMNMGHPLARAFQMELVTPAERATMNSISSLCWSGAWVLGTTWGGRLIESRGFTVSILWTAGIYLISTCLYLYFWRGGNYWRIGRR